MSISLSKAIDIGEFMEKYPKRKPSEFEGKYHHLGFKWRKFSLNRDFTELTNSLFTILQDEGEDDKNSFFSQIMWRIIERKTGSIEKLLDAAFGR